MGTCIDCGTKLYGYTKALRCKPCNGVHRKGTFKHTEETKAKISHTKTKPHTESYCKKCNTLINRRTKSNLCLSCARHDKQLKEYSNKIINGITFLSFESKDKQRNVIWKMKCHCGNIFTNKAAWIKSGRVKSCGCSHVEHCKKLGDQQRGENNPAWIKDRTKTSLYIRNKDYTRNNKGSWQYFSRKCKINCEYTCQLTNETCGSGELVTHHIESVTIQPELVIDINNVIVIKKTIHNLFHRLHGKKTTRNDWEQFLKQDFIKGTA